MSRQLLCSIFDWGEKKARVRAQKVAQKESMNSIFIEDKMDIGVNIRQVWHGLENLRTQMGARVGNVTGPADV